MKPIQERKMVWKITHILFSRKKTETFVDNCEYNNKNFIDKLTFYLLLGWWVFFIARNELRVPF